MKTDELRKCYLDFFKSKNHRVFESDSLVPPGDDKSLLFTGAGMNQFKPYFLGIKKDVSRATSCQKCLRTADLERVGKTAYHHTFFEMLGNFSFGDYFKEEAIAYGWEFVTKVMGLPKDRLWVSVYEEDDEAYDLWKNKIGIQESRIVRMDAVDNFWPSNAKADGPNGPCGPCSEIYVGQTPGKGVEIWNLVFTQFDRQSDGSLKNLPQKNIDTGMGLERAASVLQGVENNFDIDTFAEIRRALRGLIGTRSQYDVSRENAVMDHLRAVVLCVGDGVVPSNEGRGYVIRKLIRLGVDHFQRAGGPKDCAFYKLIPSITSVMGAAYTDLSSKAKNISMIVENEEKSFLDVLRTQVPKLEKEFESAKQRHQGADLDKNVTEIAFKYYDTFGVPFEIIQTTSANAGLILKKENYDELLEEQKKRSRQASQIAGEIFFKDDTVALVEGLPTTKFLGYDKLECSGKLLSIIRQPKDGSILLVFDQTPFYAESGGQVGDTGQIKGDGFLAAVLDTQSVEKRTLHKAQIEKGEDRLTEGMTCALQVDEVRRYDIMRNHTATHILQSALRKTLGDHVKQSGSMVAPDRLRFDFTHFTAVNPEQLSKTEELVNQKILAKASLKKEVLSKEKAIAEGAIAFFGEKYGDEVRVVSIGDFSKELCGGTHLDATDDIGSFKIISESSIQAGVRRIEAVTGRWAEAFIKKNEAEFNDLIREFRLDPDKRPLADQFKDRQKAVQTKRNQLLSLLSGKLKSKIDASPSDKRLPGSPIVALEVFDKADTELLKALVDELRSQKMSFACSFFSEIEGKLSFIIACSQDVAAKGFHAGQLVKSVSESIGGNGGGRPDFAVGGCKDTSRKDEARALVKKHLEIFSQHFK